MDVVNQVLVLFLLILIGYGARKLKLMGDEAVGVFSTFILNITLPALILVSLQKPFSRELLGDAGIILALSIGVYAFSFALAAVYPFLLRLGRKERGVHRYALIFSNVGFMGYPVVEAVLGSDALFYLAIYNIPFNFLAFSIGAWLISREGSRPLTLSWRTFVNPSVIATLLGFIFFLFSASFPVALLKTLKMTGDCTSPLSMIVIGAILARMDYRKIFGSVQVYVTTLLRLLVLPAMVGFALYHLVPRGFLWTLPSLVTAMPIAANTSILASVYKGDEETASSLVFLSTLACVLTIPLAAMVFAALT